MTSAKKEESSKESGIITSHLENEYLDTEAQAYPFMGHVFNPEGSTMRDYLLYCTYCSSYTLLHSYDKETGNFLGEYSLLHNDYTRNSLVANKFLLAHLGHTLKFIPSKTDEYMNIICTASRFLEDDIGKYVEDSLAKREFLERDRLSERQLGKVQIHIVEHFLRYELEKLSATRGNTPAESQVLLGQELGLKKALEIIQSVLSDKQFT